MGVLEKSKENNTSLNNKSNSKSNKKEIYKERYGEFNNVLLSNDELAKLQSEFPENWQEWIERVSDYCASKNRRYTNYLATIRNWARKERKQTIGKNDAKAGYQRALELQGIRYDEQ